MSCDVLHHWANTSLSKDVMTRDVRATGLESFTPVMEVDGDKKDGGGGFAGGDFA